MSSRACNDEAHRCVCVRVSVCVCACVRVHVSTCICVCVHVCLAVVSAANVHSVSKRSGLGADDDDINRWTTAAAAAAWWDSDAAWTQRRRRRCRGGCVMEWATRRWLTCVTLTLHSHSLHDRRHAVCTDWHLLPSLSVRLTDCVKVSRRHRLGYLTDSILVSQWVNVPT